MKTVLNDGCRARYSQLDWIAYPAVEALVALPDAQSAAAAPSFGW